MRVPTRPLMSLAIMRQKGVRAVTATCESCNRSADGSVAPRRADRGPEGRPAPPMQPVQREGDIDEARLAHGVPTLSTAPHHYAS
jgi:hypothetical protein